MSDEIAFVSPRNRDIREEGTCVSPEAFEKCTFPNYIGIKFDRVGDVLNLAIVTASGDLWESEELSNILMRIADALN